MGREIKRGEIYWVDWSPSRGSEQAGTRPAVVVQNDIGNQFSPTTIVAACTSAPVKPYPFIVPLDRKESGLSDNCSVNCSAILTIDKNCLREKCGSLGTDKMHEVDLAIKKSLALE